MNKLMNEYEKTALDFFLSKYPSDSTFYSIVDCLYYGDDEEVIVPWQPFEMQPSHEVAALIIEMKLILERTFIPRDPPIPPFIQITKWECTKDEETK